MILTSKRRPLLCSKTNRSSNHMVQTSLLYSCIQFLQKEATLLSESLHSPQSVQQIQMGDMDLTNVAKTRWYEVPCMSYYGCLDVPQSRLNRTLFLLWMRKNKTSGKIQLKRWIKWSVSFSMLWRILMRVDTAYVWTSDRWIFGATGVTDTLVNLRAVAQNKQKSRPIEEPSEPTIFILTESWITSLSRFNFLPPKCAFQTLQWSIKKM
jgi:hypothetical protein